MLGVISAIADYKLKNGPFSPKKASFEVETKEGPIVLSLPHMLNPTDLKIGRKVSWKCQPGQNTETAKSAPYQVFGGGGDTLSFSMVFDCSEKVAVSLTKELEGMYDLTYPFTDHGKNAGKRAQIVKFQWESFAFLGVVDSVDITVTLFDPQGRIKRATVGIAMQGWAFSKLDIDADKFFEQGREKANDKTAAAYVGGGTKSSAAEGGIGDTLAKFGI